MKRSSVRKWVMTVSVATVALAVFAAVVAVRGLSGSVDELRMELAKNEAGAILAKADIGSDSTVAVPVLYYDQAADECVDMYGKQGAIFARQFEWENCGYYRSEIESGLVESELGTDYLPVAVGGIGTPNRGMGGENFKRWFSVVEKQSKSYAGTLTLNYNSDASSFYYASENFYPLAEIVGEERLFTLNLAVPFRTLANGDEEFTVEADDDTWVFIGKDLVIDMGGIHDAATGRFRIDNDGRVYSGVEELEYIGVTLDVGEDTIVRIFHANRNSGGSVFDIEFTNMVLNIMNTSLAQSDSGAQVAYDPENPSYVAPLGESMEVGPNMKRPLMVAIVVQTMSVGVFSILAMVAISVAWRYSRRDHNRGE